MRIVNYELVEENKRIETICVVRDPLFFPRIGECVVNGNKKYRIIDIEYAGIQANILCIEEQL